MMHHHKQTAETETAAMNCLLKIAAYTVFSSTCPATYKVTLSWLQGVSNFGTRFSASRVEKTFWWPEYGMDYYANTGSSPFLFNSNQSGDGELPFGSQFRWQMSAWKQLTFNLISMKRRFYPVRCLKVMSTNKACSWFTCFEELLLFQSQCPCSLSVFIWVYGMQMLRCSNLYV